MRKMAILVGTRPGIVKMSVVYHAICKSRNEPVLIHSGQHYSAMMDDEIMRDVELPAPDYRSIRPDDCTSHGAQTAFMLENIEKHLIESKPDMLFVCGDANTNLAGALAARKLGIGLAHVEAGLRSYDWRMPEEHNRRMIDHISDLHFAPTTECVAHLKKEAVLGDVHCVGNTVADAALRYRSQNNKKTGRAIMTLHREENVDDASMLKHIISECGKIAEHSNLLIDFFVHPRTRKNIDNFKLWDDISDKIVVSDTVKYVQMLNLMSQAEFILTDSGGLQEESCILGTPCYTLRVSTERPETVECGSNIVLGTEDIYNRFVMNFPFPNKGWLSPFGSGDASTKIVKIAEQWLNK